MTRSDRQLILRMAVTAAGLVLAVVLLWLEILIIGEAL